MAKYMFMLAICLFAQHVISQEVKQDSLEQQQRITLLFMGDIMQHDAQIEAAYLPQHGWYDYDDYFQYLSPLYRSVDFPIANLELTFAGKPYQGYPHFSAPDELAKAIKDAGITHLVTANNHSVDHDGPGLERTLDMLKLRGFEYTGTFRDSVDRFWRNPMVLEKNNIKVAIFNYSYGTNYRKVDPPNIVNLIDTALIKQDLLQSRDHYYDAKIIVFHWGLEYKRKPSKRQQQVADFCFRNGADIIIGAHPHVLQKNEQYDFMIDSATSKNVLIAYSMGNYVSNYKSRYKDGGSMIQFDLVKDEQGIHIEKAGYHLVWVHKPKDEWKQNYIILPCSMFEKDTVFMTDSAKLLFDEFVNDSRTLFDTEENGIGEYLYNDSLDQWVFSEKEKKTVSSK